MYCKNCGRLLPDSTLFCTGCGANQKEETFSAQDKEPTPSVGLPEAIKLFFVHYFDFKGRTRRSAFWWAYLFYALVFLVCLLKLPRDIAYLWVLFIFIPSISLCVRRLHDTGRSGWWYFLMCIPTVGNILLFILCCKDSQGPNRWGASPKY